MDVLALLGTLRPCHDSKWKMEEIWVTHEPELKEPPLEQLSPKALCSVR